MIKNFILYLKTQLLNIITLHIVAVLPLVLFYKYSSYPLPKVQYVVILLLLSSQFVFYKEKAHRKILEEKVKAQHQKRFGKLPSRKELYHSVTFLVNCRLANRIVTTASIFITMIWFKEF